MTEKQKKILEMLSQQGDNYVSGQALAEMLSCSRAAVWKAIKYLREKGYSIEAVTHKGYRLMSSRKEMENDIYNQLKNAELHMIFDVHVVESTNSTNLVVRKEGLSDQKEGYVCVALMQEEGRGRQGKAWISDSTDGLWFSLLLRPDILAEHTGLLSLFFAWVVSQAIRDCGLNDVGIKWPNDIISLKSSKKICGILSEASFEDEKLSFAIMGCGINVSHDTFPSIIKEIATSLKKEGLTIDLATLLVFILKRFSVAYPDFKNNPRTFISHYKMNCVTLGREVSIRAQEQVIGKAIDVSEKGALVVEMPDHTKREFFAGEVSVRGLMGYV